MVRHGCLFVVQMTLSRTLVSVKLYWVYHRVESNVREVDDQITHLAMRGGGRSAVEVVS